MTCISTAILPCDIFQLKGSGFEDTDRHSLRFRVSYSCTIRKISKSCNSTERYNDTFICIILFWLQLGYGGLFSVRIMMRLFVGFIPHLVHTCTHTIFASIASSPLSLPPLVCCPSGWISNTTRWYDIFFKIKFVLDLYDYNRRRREVICCFLLFRCNQWKHRKCSFTNMLQIKRHH